MLHLKSRAQFQALLAHRPVALTPHFALHWLDTAVPVGSGAAPAAGLFKSPLHPVSQPQSWLGVMVPKRWAKRAVTRNTIKRQAFAVSASSWRGSAHGADPAQRGACLIRLRTSFDRQTFVSATSEALRAAVRAELLDLWRIALRKQPGLVATSPAPDADSEGAPVALVCAPAPTPAGA